MKAAAYLRVSTDQQAEQGYGLAVQRRAITAWARANGHRITGWYADEGVSGTNGLDTRPGLAACFRALEAGQAEMLLVYRLDRLSRKLGSQIAWTEQLEAKGRQVVSVTEPDVGQDEMRDLVRHIIGAIAQYERATIVRRMQDGRAAKAAQGGYAYGAPAYGQRAEGGRLAADEAEQAAIARMRELSGAGASLRAVAAALDAEGIRPKRGERWHPQTVARALARAR